MGLPKRLIALAALPILLASLGGCMKLAGDNYPSYVEKKGTAAVEREKTRQTAAQAMGTLANAPGATPEQRGMAMAGLLAIAFSDKPDGIEAPKEGAIERGVGRSLETVARGVEMVGFGAGARLVADAVKGNSSSQDRHDVNVDGSFNTDRHDTVVSGGTP
jgi:hypothetical protein